MTKSEIVNLAYEAGCPSIIVPAEWFKFAALVAAAERKACAKVCDDLVLAHPGRADLTAQQCALAIRERGAP